MKPLICFVGMLLPIYTLQAQVVVDNFDDQNISLQPQWLGDTASFIVNETLELQLFDTTQQTNSKYLSTIFEAIYPNDMEWRFDLRMEFSPSNSNKIRYYLASNNSILMPDTASEEVFRAYFVEIGETGSQDAISLFYQEGNDTQIVCRGFDGQFSSAFHYSIQVMLTAGENWTIAIAEAGTSSYEPTATGNHPVNHLVSALGLRCFFTASRSKLFYFDNVYLGEIISDSIPPELLQGELEGNNGIYLRFSEAVFTNYDNELAHFSLVPEAIMPEALFILEDSMALTFSKPFESGTDYQLHISGLADELNNEMLDTTFVFTYILPEPAQAGDLIITEFLADPYPTVSLPESEFIEIYNRSEKYIDISNFSVKDQSSTVGVLPAYIMAPASFLLIVPESSSVIFEEYGMMVSPDKWPALNNGSDSIIIMSPDSIIIDELYYNNNFYEEDKRDGGYSLELINRQFDCFHSSNWAASTHDSGGTPGSNNSVDDPHATGPSPTLSAFHIRDEREMVLLFDLPIKLNDLETFTVLLNDQGVQFSSDILLDQLVLQLDEGLQQNESYVLDIKGLMSCNGAILENFNYTFVFDLIAPAPTEVFFVTDSTFLLSFNEPIFYDENELINYFLFEEPVSFSSIEPYTVQTLLIQLNDNLTTNQSYHLKVNGLKDAFGNIAENVVFEFSYFPPSKLGHLSLLITELMVKPAADQILPDTEYIELRNMTGSQIPLVGLTICDEKDTSVLPLTVLKPNEYVVLCPKSKAFSFDESIKTVGLSPWPSLNNAGDVVSLLDHQFQVINQVAYNDSWYRDEEKEEEGGWSLEIIDIQNPCAGKPNWIASNASIKGSPGLLNSVSEAFPDSFGPELLSATAINATIVKLAFTEMLPPQAFSVDQFSISPYKAVKGAKLVGLSAIELQLADSLKEKVLYELVVKKVTDCVGNLVPDDFNTVSFALVEKAIPTDIILNEILYDPVAGGVDFIEFYNRSDKYINLRNWSFSVNDKRVILFPENDQVVGPYQYLVLTEDKQKLVNSFPTSVDPAAIYSFSLPNLPNEQGEVVLYGPDTLIHQKLNYEESMHLSFLKDTEGVSLERISPDAEISSKDSWSSASSKVGYATPGRTNSQLKYDFEQFGTVSASPKSFSPYLSGRSYTVINYEVADVGSIGDLKIFNKNGQLIKTLVNNEALGSTGYYRWDGDNDQGELVATGYYIIYFSIFNGNGKTKTIIETVAVAAY